MTMYGPKQCFDDSSTALQVLHGLDLSNKTVAITGPTSGIGYETARSIALHGAHVILLCRNVNKAKNTLAAIKREKPTCRIEIVECDLCSLKSVKRCAQKYKQQGWPLHILILNAGVFGAPFTRTEDFFEMTFQVNHLAQFFLVQLLQDILAKSAPGRVVFVSSESHKYVGSSVSVDNQYITIPNRYQLTVKNMTEEHLSPHLESKYYWMHAYNVSKMCQLLTAFSLDRQLSPRGVECCAVHPGVLMSTSLCQKSCVMTFLTTMYRPLAKSMQQGAATTVYTACAPELETVCGGKYFHNCWFFAPDPVAEETDLQQKLWDVSVEMIARATGETWENLKSSDL